MSREARRDAGRGRRPGPAVGDERGMGRERDDVRSGTGLVALSFGMWGGLLAWGVHLLVAMGLVGAACTHDMVWAIHVTTVVTALAAGAAVAVAWRAWHAALPASSDRWDVPGRESFMALVGMLLSGLGLLFIVFEGIPPFFVGACG